MTREEAEIYAKTMTYEDALHNLSRAKAIPYRKATFIKVNELIKVLSQEPSRDIKEIAEIMKCDADATAKGKMISNILNAEPHYFREQNPCDKCAMKNSNSNYCKNCTVSEYHGKIVGVPTKFIEQEPCFDAVSRSLILNKIREVCFGEEWLQFRLDKGSNGQRDFIIDYIEQLPSVNPQYTGNEFFNFDASMVKKSMEQDTISREDARMMLTCEIKDGMTITEYIKMVDRRLRELPSVTPQPSEHFIDGVHAMGYREGYKDAQKQKSGKWLLTHLSNMAYCSECDFLFKDIPASIVKHFKHCPNCGMRMVEPQERSNKK